MKLYDTAVLERLHLMPQDLSSARGFLEVGVEPPSQTSRDLTHAVLRVRGLLPRDSAAHLVVRRQGNPGFGSTASNLNGQTGQPTVKPPVVWVPVIPLTRDSFEVLQRFDGIVLSITNDSFVARLTDKTHSGSDEEAEIPLAEVTRGDRELVKPGAMFYWVIGYRREAYGQISRSSVIRFQRVPPWSDADIERAQKEAETFLSFLDLDKANNPA